MPKKNIFLFLLILAIESLAFGIVHQNLSTIQKQAEPSLFPVAWDGNCGYIDSKGNLVLQLPKGKYGGGKFSDGLALIGMFSSDPYGGLRGFIDATGKIVIEPKFRTVESFSEGLARVEIDGKVGYIDKQGRLAIEPRFEQDSGRSFSEGLAAAKIFVEERVGVARKFKYLTGYISKEGSFAIQPRPLLSYAGPFKEGMACFSDSISTVYGKYGYMDKAGEVVVPSQFPRAFDFSEGLAMVMVESEKDSNVRKVGYIDKSGNFVIKPNFDDTLIVTVGPASISEVFTYDIFGTEGTFSEGLASVKIKGKYGFIDRSGQVVIPPQFVHAGMFKEGLAPVAIKNGRRRVYGFIDHSGKYAIKPQFDLVREFNNGLAAVTSMGPDRELDKYGYIDKTGKYVWKPTRY